MYRDDRDFGPLGFAAWLMILLTLFIVGIAFLEAAKILPVR